MDVRTHDGVVVINMVKLQTMIKEILEDDGGEVNVSQFWHIDHSFTRVLDKDIIFGLKFKSVKDHDMVWQQRFTLGESSYLGLVGLKMESNSGAEDPKPQPNPHPVAPV